MLASAKDSDGDGEPFELIGPTGEGFLDDKTQEPAPLLASVKRPAPQKPAQPIPDLVGRQFVEIVPFVFELADEIRILVCETDPVLVIPPELE